VSIISPLLALAAGVLSVLSPCVLPLLPILLSGAASRHPLGPAALAAGLAASFTLVGLALSTVGYAVGLDAQLLGRVGGATLVLVGVVLLTPTLRLRLAAAAAPLEAWGQQRVARLEVDGPIGQAGLGALLGLVWTPCVGPTLGAASLLAARGRDLAEVSIVMLAFGLGAAGALAAIGYLARTSLSRWTVRLRGGGELGRRALGASLMLLGALMAFGLEHQIEAALVGLSPDWLTRLTSRY
jgi:cytochrome c-type biogenesis protein